AVALLSLDAGGSPGLRWSAPPACADLTEVRARIEGLLGRPLADTDLEIAGEIEASSPDAWALELTLGRPGEVTRRRLVAARCSTLIDAAALLVAVLVDPVAAASALAWPSAGGDALGEAAIAVEGARPIGDAAATSADVAAEVAEVAAINDHEENKETRETRGLMAEAEIAAPKFRGGYA